jgi:hypothetical protein
VATKHILVEEICIRRNLIYNADTSGLYWKGFSTGTIAFERKMPNCKSFKEYLLIRCYANASRKYKMKLLV